MPRTPRLDEHGARHHVMNRAARKDVIFRNDADYALFLEVLAGVPTRFGAQIHGYALMPNHYHLMVETPRGNLSQVMRHVGGVFSQAYNREHRQDGPVFRGRFKNQLVTDDAYWMHLLAYLHLNPVAAGLVKRPGDSPHTSHGAYVDAKARPDWLSTDAMIALFGGRERLLTYVEDIRLHRRPGPVAFEPAHFWRPTNTVEVPESPQPPPLRSLDEAVNDVSRLTGLSLARLRERPRGPSAHVGPWLLVWWLRRGAGMSQSEIAAWLGVSRPRVSQILARMEALRRQDPTVAHQLNGLQLLLAPGA